MRGPNIKVKDKKEKGTVRNAVKMKREGVEQGKREKCTRTGLQS
jgi:hypothetical protein